ncbi:MAG: hypothetical protein H7Y17_16440 [Chlorobia bacterium]|nr:hypothetical protein [Fimbriimonadaceae bacterium]
MAILTSVLVSQASTQNEEAWAQRLGKARSVFGDIKNSGLWKHGYTGQFGGTYILFRAGSSTERYYYTTSPGANRWRISRVTKLNGKIRKDWMIFIEKGTEARIGKPGPLWLWAGKGKVVGSLPKKALADLRSQVPLACYHSNVHSSYCLFIFPDGKVSEYMPWEDGVALESNGASFDMLPKTREPYPITSEEREYAYRKSCP